MKCFVSQRPNVHGLGVQPKQTQQQQQEKVGKDLGVGIWVR